MKRKIGYGNHGKNARKGKQKSRFKGAAFKD
jgi:hypothetical protein